MVVRGDLRREEAVSDGSRPRGAQEGPRRFERGEVVCNGETVNKRV